MKYLVACTLEERFLWEARVQLTNFEKVGIKSSDVYYLFLCVGNDKYWVPKFDALKAEFPEVNLYLFYDMREVDVAMDYAPTCRPHVIAQFFETNNILEGKSILYVDSDILFNMKPDEIALQQTDIWWGSDTKGYTSTKYILEKGGPWLLADMTQIVGVDYLQVFNLEDKSFVGAQTVIKDVDARFWRDVERHCYELFRYMTDSVEYFMDIHMEMIKHEMKKEGKDISKVKKQDYTYNPVQAFCADMWAVNWNALKRGRTLEVTPMLDFAQATDTLEVAVEKPIYHNNGIVGGGKPFNPGNAFWKHKFRDEPPFAQDFSYVDENSATKIYVEGIYEYELRLANQHKTASLLKSTI